MTTSKVLRVSKRDAARQRRLSGLTEEEFEATIAQWRAHWKQRGPERSFESFLPDRKNSRQHRSKKIAADIDRLISNAKAIEEAAEFDASRSGAMMLKLAKFTRNLWQSIKSE